MGSYWSSLVVIELDWKMGDVCEFGLILKYDETILFLIRKCSNLQWVLNVFIG